MKLKFYALKTSKGLMQDPSMERPIIFPYTKEAKEKLLEIRKLMGAKEVKLIKLFEV